MTPHAHLSSNVLDNSLIHWVTFVLVTFDTSSWPFPYTDAECGGASDIDLASLTLLTVTYGFCLLCHVNVLLWNGLQARCIQLHPCKLFSIFVTCLSQTKIITEDPPCNVFYLCFALCFMFTQMLHTTVTFVRCICRAKTWCSCRSGWRGRRHATLNCVARLQSRSRYGYYVQRMNLLHSVVTVTLYWVCSDSVSESDIDSIWQWGGSDIDRESKCDSNII